MASVVKNIVQLLSVKYGFDAKAAMKIMEKDVTEDVDMLHVDNWKRDSSKEVETQLSYYTRMKSREEVLDLVGLQSKPFGTKAEKFIQNVFKLGPRTSTQNDGVRNGKKIEIKTARYWAGKDECRWQHLEPDHDYEVVLFVLLDFDKWNVWAINKHLLIGELMDKKIVTSNQFKALGNRCFLRVIGSQESNSSFLNAQLVKKSSFIGKAGIALLFIDNAFWIGSFNTLK